MAYGYCPHCHGVAISRERRPNGDDTCENGHKYPSRLTLKQLPDADLRSLVRAFFEAEMDTAGGAPDKMPAYHRARSDLARAVDWMQHE